MVARPGTRRFLHLAQQRIHLVRLQPAVRPGTEPWHAMVAATWSRMAFRPSDVSCSAISSARSRTSLLRVDLAQHGGRFGARRQHLGPKASMTKPEAVTAFPRGQPSRPTSSSGRSTISGYQAASAPPRAVECKSVLQRLIDQALVRGMLVDNDQAVLGLRDDIVGVDLCPRRAERRRQAVPGGALIGCSRPRISGIGSGSAIVEGKPAPSQQTRCR